jgi:hypothetical protein
VKGNTRSLGMASKYRILASCGRGADTKGATGAVLGLRECACALHGRMHGVCAPTQPDPEGALGHQINHI